MVTNKELVTLAAQMAALAQTQANQISTAVDKAAQKKLNELVRQLTKLTDKKGVFSANNKTVAEAVKVARLFNEIGSDKELQASLAKYTNAYPKLAALNNEYLQLAFGVNTKTALAADLTESALSLVGEQLSKEAIYYTVGLPIKQVVTAAIRNKGTIESVTEALQQMVLGTNGGGGLADSEISRIARDSIFQFNRDYLNGISVGIDIQYYLYAGSEIASSRPFCKARNDEVFKREVVLSWQKMDWQGKKEGDIFSVCGGYNCRHRLLPYPAELVNF